MPTLNWANNNDTNSYEYSTLGLTNRGERKTILINTNYDSSYTIDWLSSSISSVPGTFKLITNLYDNTTKTEIDMKTQNSVTIDPTNIYQSQNSVRSAVGLESKSDPITYNYIINDADKHPLYDYFANFNRSSLSTMKPGELDKVQANIDVVKKIICCIN